MRICGALDGSEDQKHDERGDDDAYNDEDKCGAGETCSLLRRSGRRSHAELDAGLDLYGGFGEDLRIGIYFIWVWWTGVFAGVFGKMSRQVVVF